MFLCQEAGMNTLSFGEKMFSIEATQVRLLKIRGGFLFLPGTVVHNPAYARYGLNKNSRFQVEGVKVTTKQALY